MVSLNKEKKTNLNINKTYNSLTFDYVYSGTFI